ncbi:DUF6456 domain-containing protein [Oricola sp.]|uniref:DUF6456 domain-containing protein n=1 Tax=Oricola sp. TaxID=1979950 RepID=UPI003BAA9C04
MYEDTRTLYFLRLVAQYRPTMLATADPQTLLLRLVDDRSVRLPRKHFDRLRKRGLVEALGDGPAQSLLLTEAGQALEKRSAGAGFAAQHQERVPVRNTGERSEPVLENLDESPIGAIARMRRPDGTPWFMECEIDAAERLRSDFEKAMLGPRMTASWEPKRGGDRHTAKHAVVDLSDRALHARRKVNAAIAALGPELAGATLDICCFLKGLEQVERERGWPRRSAKLMLKTALSMLVRHYRPDRQSDTRQAPIRQWGADGFRPPIAD